MPAEFHEYANFVSKYESENPGEYYIAKQFGKRISGASSSDLMQD